MEQKILKVDINLQVKDLSISLIRQNQIKVGVLRSFTFNPQNHQILQITQQRDIFEMWVYPDGIKIYDTTCTVINDSQPEFSFTQPNIIHPGKVLNTIQLTQDIKQPPDNFYSFVLTDYQLNRTYCTCLVWNEKRFVENDEDESGQNQVEKCQKSRLKIANLNSKILPKCTLNQLIEDPLILEPSSCVVYIPKGIILFSRHPCLTLQRQLICFIYINAIKKIGEASLHQQQINQLGDLIAKFGYPRAQKLYDQHEFLNQKQAKSKLQSKQMPIKPYQLHSKKTYKQLQREKKQTQLNLHNLRTLNKNKLDQFYFSLPFLPQLVQSFQPSSTPPQIMNIQDTISSQRKFSFHPYYFSSTCFRMPNFDILGTIEKIGVEILLTLWKNAMLQRQILVFSWDQFLTIQVFETLLYLIEPLKWQNIYIPFLPFHLCHHIEALGGYLIGMSKLNMNYMIEHFNLQSKVFVDLDQMIIIEEGGNADTYLPPSIRNWMLRELQNLGFNLKPKTVQEKIWHLNLSRIIPPQIQKPQKQDYKTQVTIQTVFKLRRTFYVALFYLLNNYSQFISQQAFNVRLERESYLHIFYSLEEKQFCSQLVKTMMFIRLCQFHKNAEKSLKWNQFDICSLFVYCHFIMKQEDSNCKYWDIKYFDSNLSLQDNQMSNASKLKQYVDFVLKKNLKEITTTDAEQKTYKIQHYLVKYLFYKNYNRPGIIQIEQQKVNFNTPKWLESIWQFLSKQQVEQRNKKKQKLNLIHNFFSHGKNILDLKRLFQNIGDVIINSFRKNM